jgi:uncharacterized protein YaiL (DUF2058 family)
LGNSLHDQLLKAGLVNRQQVQQTEKAQRKKARQQQKGQSRPADPARVDANRTRREQAARDRELNRQRQAKQQARQDEAKIRQLIAGHRLPADEGEIAYSFVHDPIVARIFVSESQQKQLGQGRIAIVTLDGAFVLVPAAVAVKIRETDASRVIVCNDGERDEAIDSDYADYQVPDDLMW